jgi:hypothetical protein
LPDCQSVFFGKATDPIWQIKGDKPQQHGEYKVNLTGAQAVALSADGKRVAATTFARVFVHELETAKLLWEWTPPPHFGAVRGVALSPDGSHLLTANDDGTVYIIRVPDRSAGGQP